MGIAVRLVVSSVVLVLVLPTVWCVLMDIEYRYLQAHTALLVLPVARLALPYLAHPACSTTAYPPAHAHQSCPNANPCQTAKNATQHP